MFKTWVVHCTIGAGCTVECVCGMAAGFRPKAPPSAVVSSCAVPTWPSNGHGVGVPCCSSQQLVTRKTRKQQTQPVLWFQPGFKQGFKWNRRGSAKMPIDTRGPLHLGQSSLPCFGVRFFKSDHWRSFESRTTQPQALASHEGAHIESA